MSQWNSNPFASIGSTTGSSGFDFSPHSTRSSKGGGTGGLTTQQILALQLALHHQKSGSFWNEVKHAGGSAFHPVGWTLDKLMRPLYGVAGGLTEGQLQQNKNQKKGESLPGWRGNVFEAMGRGFVHGIEGKTHHTSSDFLRADPHTAKFARRHKIITGAAGFGLDVAADPLTYVTGGAGGVLAKSAEHSNLIMAGDYALHGADHPESLKQAEQALARGGKDYSHRRALAAERLSQLTKGADAGAPDRLHELQNVAQAEKKRVEQFLPQFHIGARGHGLPLTPKYLKSPLDAAARDKIANFMNWRGLPAVGGEAADGIKSLGKLTPGHTGGAFVKRTVRPASKGVRVVPALPKLDNFIKAGVPGASHVAEGFRNKFIRAAGETPEAHAAIITRQHIAEAHAAENLNIVRDVLRGTRISEDKALKALHYGETHKNFIIKTKTGRFRINEGAITRLVRDGKLDDSQVHFLRGWFKATQLLHAKDAALGVAYHHTGESGQLYVPHLVDKLGNPLVDLQKNLLTKAAYQHSRGKGGLSVLQMAEKAKAGELGRGVETDPYKLLAHTARARAQKQADMAVATAYARHFGIKTRVVDEAKLAKTHLALAQATMEHGVHTAGQADALAAAHHAEQQFLSGHEQAFGDRLAELEKQLRSHKFRNNHVLKKANMARVQKQIIRLHEKHISDLEQINAGTHAPLAKHIAPHINLAAQHTDAVAAIEKQQGRLETEIRRLKVGKANRGVYSKKLHVTPSAPAGVDVFRDEHGNKLAFHPEVAHAITKYQKIASGEDQAIQDFSKGWRKYLAKWKMAVTSVNPGYRIRNSMSDVWAMYLKGVPMNEVPVYAAKAERLMRAAKRPDTEAGKRASKIILEAQHHGILSGLFAGDVQKVAAFLKYSGGKRALIRTGHPVQAGTKMMQDMNAHVENLGRMTHYLYRREVLHESPVEAAFHVKAAHFDYEDLTPFEQNKMKAVAPFYTWARKNIPFQVKALVSAPGKFAALPKFMAESEQASGGDKGNIIPDYISQGLGFQIPVGKHNYYMPQIGAADLQVFDSPGGALSRVEGLINPAFRLPAELATNTNLYTGAKIKSDTHERNPVSNIGADILKFIPGSDVGQTSRKVGGKTVYGPGANPKLAYLLGQVPMLRQLGLNYSGINSKRNATNAASYFGGQSVQNVDPAQQKMIESIKLQDQLKKEVTSLRDAGLYPKAKGKKSKHQKLIDQALFGRESR